MEETEQYAYPGHLFSDKTIFHEKGYMFFTWIHTYIYVCVYICVCVGVSTYVGEPKLTQNGRMDQNICKLKSK